MRDRGASGQVTGVVRSVERVPADDVAGDVRFDADHVVVFAVDTGERRVRALEAWPSSGHASSRLARVLDAVGKGVDGPRALTGEAVVVEQRESVHRLAVEATEAHHATDPGARHPSHSVTELVVGAGALAGFLAVLAVAAGRLPVGVTLAVAAVALLSLSLFADAHRTDIEGWSPRATPWAVGGLVPVLNVAVAMAYLSRKTVAIDGEGETTVWRDVLYGVVAAFAVGLALAALDLTAPVAAAVTVHAWALAPLAVYLDGGSTRHGSTRPNRAPWVAGAACVGGAGALVYLLKTA